VEDDSWYLNDMCLEYGSHRLADVNGDVLVDLIDGRDEGANYCRDQGELREIYIHNGTKQYLLKNITNSFGGITVIDYQKSTSFNNTGDDELSDLGFNVWVVANITKSNGIVGEHYTSFVSNYIYSGGVYDYQDEEFRGFNFVEEETNTKKTKYWFHQNDALKGKNYFSRIFGIYYYLGDKNHTIYNDLDSGWTDWGGVGIKFNSSIEQYLYQVERIGVFPEVYLKNSSGSLIASALFEGDIATFENPVLLSEGEEYWLEANTSGYSFSKSLPLELESITIIDENCAGFGPHLCNFEKIIMIYTEENATLSRENLTLEIINDWEYEESQNIYTSFLKENSNILYNSENETKTKNVSYSYDSFGNIIYIYNKGDVENNEDDFFEYKSFLNNSEKWIVDKAKEIKFYASDNSTKLKGNRYYYDKQAYGEAPTKGDLTRVDLWNSQSLNINYEYSYDSYGNLINETDPVKNTIKYYYGIRDTTYTFPDKIEDGEGLVREFEHDLGFGTLSWIKSSNGKYNNYTYDVFGRILSEINVYDDEELPTKVYSYDFDGISPEKVKISDREKNHTEYTFDKYNFYDGFGNLIQTKIEARDNKQIVGNFFYDHLGRLIKKSNPYFETAFINYSTVNGSIPSINFSYDVLNRNTFILNPDGSNKTTVYSLWNILYFDENGNKIEHNLNAYGNIFEILEYNDSENKFETSYTYDDLGRLILIEDSEQNIWNYTYDDLGRLTKEIDPDIGSSNHTYDYAGNLVEEYVGRADLKEDGDYVRQYDDFGNLIIVTIDKENSSRLVELYYYDPEGNRIKTVRHRENVTIYTPFRELMVIVNSSGTFNYTYIYEGDTLVAKVNPDGSKYYYHPDLLGSTTLVTNESGDIFEETFYSPYGLVLEGGEEEIKLYEGKELDSTGQYYYGARYYDPEKRLFIQADQMIPDIYDPQQLNRYSFERNNPYTYTDPSGNSPTLITGAIGYVFGYAAGAISSVIKQLSNKGSVNLLEVGVTAGTWGVAGGVFGLTGSLAYSALGKGVAAGIGAGTFAGSLSGEAELITSSVLNNDFDQLKDPVAHAEAVGYGGLIGGATGGAFGLAGSMAKNSKTVFTSISKSSTLGYLKGGNMPKGVSSSAKNFFGGATGKSNQFNIINSKNSYNFNFFSPARTPGYGKLYTMKTNLKGDVIERIKYTINPKGKAIKTTKY